MIKEPAIHFVNFSMGVSSAYIACRWQDEGKNPICVFSDTGQEDIDTYRFGWEVAGKWGLDVVEANAGISLFDWFEKQKMIPARQLAACSIALKILPSQKYYKSQPDGAIAYGYDLKEQERADRTERTWKLDGKKPVFPMIEKGISKEEAMGYFIKHNVKLPRVYEHFSHANCMPCKNWRVNDWQACRVYFPDVFIKSMEFENRTGLKFLQDGPYLRDLPEVTVSRKGRHALPVPSFNFDMGCDRCATD
jgi:3'-phosphoadenosine 5'-phosphosulfate sulfotransferase (PAPS reductase)/FAD synthetase